MAKILMIIMLGIFPLIANAQELVLKSMSTDSFPIIKAQIQARDKQGFISQIQSGEITVLENGKPVQVLSIQCPRLQIATPISSCLIFDISGSMRYRASGRLSRMDIAKAAGRAWVGSMPLDISECAITSFNNAGFLNQDFTQDSNLLIRAINALTPNGGTAYDAALIDPPAGGLLITRKARYAPVIVFLSDGEPNNIPRVQQIIDEAKAQNCRIFAVMLGLTAPRYMNDICNQSGGFLIDNVNTLQEALDIYLRILEFVQGYEPCTITWQSSISCDSMPRNVEIQWRGATVRTQYKPPANAISKLEFSTSTVRFPKPPVNVRIDSTIKVYAINGTRTVQSVQSSNPAFFITPQSFTLAAGDSIELMVSYIAPDSGLAWTTFTFESDSCPAVLQARGGWPGISSALTTLTLVHPNGGQIFVAGSDTVITWKGIDPNEYVRLDYSIDNGQTWYKVTDSAIGLSYKWRVPRTPSNLCLARVIAYSPPDTIPGIQMMSIPAGNFIMGNTGTAAGNPDELPVQNITISQPFLMSQFEILQKDFYAVLKRNPSQIKADSLPVESITFMDIVEFCNALSDLQGYTPCYTIAGSTVTCNWSADGYRLPTEAEWEYACKAGTSTDLWSGAIMNLDCAPLDGALDIMGWYCGNSLLQAQKAGLKSANTYGLHDMHGNIAEYCWDLYDLYPGMAQTDPKGPANAMNGHILRGGSFLDEARNCRSSVRFMESAIAPAQRGFRIVRISK
jgi:formylglycine-generating enzyme required for sulfatase activity/uncharacterized protein YegL